jgi:endonuclease-3 related protein
MENNARRKDAEREEKREKEDFNIVVYNELKKFYKEKKQWWPWEKTVYMPISAILTQATNWRNVEKAINNLKNAGIKTFEDVINNASKLEELIKPAGFYRQKAKRIIALANLFIKKKNIERDDLLSLNGFGKETADSILLYHFDKPYFVIDNYTKRLHERLTGKKEQCYEKLAAFYGKSLTVEEMKEFHALIVEHCKNTCKKEPLCDKCPLINLCFYYKNHEARNKKG